MRLAPEFVEKLRTVAATAKIGDPMLATTNIGPVTTLPHYNKVLDYLAIAKAEGARCVLAISYLMPFGGMKHSGLGRENGINAVHEFLETKGIWISAANAAPANPYIMRLSS